MHRLSLQILGTHNAGSKCLVHRHLVLGRFRYCCSIVTVTKGLATAASLLKWIFIDLNYFYIHAINYSISGKSENKNSSSYTMNIFKKTKIYPEEETLTQTEDSSSESESDNSISDYSDADVVKFHIDNETEEICKEGQRPEEEDRFNKIFYWNEFLQAFESQIEERAGTKQQLYMLDGTPLKKKIDTGSGLHMITDEIIKSFGLEFLHVVSDVVIDAFFHRKIPLADILVQLQSLNYKEHSGKKLWIWIDDQPLEDMDPNLSFGRMLTTELLIRNIEPQAMIPCHDLDEEVLYELAKTLIESDRPETESQAAVALQGIFKIGLSLLLAAKNCNIILIDGDRAFYDVPDFHSFMAFVEHLKHKVIHLRHNPTVTDKAAAVERIVEKVIRWQKSKSETADKNVSSPPPSSDIQLLQSSSQATSDNAKSSEIVYKLTPDHFTYSENEESDLSSA